MLVARSSNHLHSFTGRCLRGELLRVMEEHGQMIAPEMKLGIKVTALSIISFRWQRHSLGSGRSGTLLQGAGRKTLVRVVGASLGDSSDVGVVQVGISPTRLLLHKLDDTALFLLLLLWYKQSLPRIRVVRGI